MHLGIARLIKKRKKKDQTKKEKSPLNIHNQGQYSVPISCRLMSYLMRVD